MGDRHPTGHHPAGGERSPPRAEGQGPRRAGRVVCQLGPNRVLHGRGPVHRPSGGLLPLVAPLLSGHSDVSIGSRFNGAHTWYAAHAVRPCRTCTVSCFEALCGTSSPTPPAASRSGTERDRGDPSPSRVQGGPGSSTRNSWCWPSGTGFASMKCRVELGGRRRLPGEHPGRCQGRPPRRGSSHSQSSDRSRRVTTPGGTGAHLHSSQATRTRASAFSVPSRPGDLLPVPRTGGDVPRERRRHGHDDVEHLRPRTVHVRAEEQGADRAKQCWPVRSVS